MADRKIDESPVLAQIRADEGVAGSRARKEAQRAASRDEQREGRTNRKGLPARKINIDGNSDGHRGYAVPVSAETPEPKPASATVSRLGVTNGEE
jgi:hypothetical protein